MCQTSLVVKERLNGPAAAGGKAHYYGIAIEELCWYGYDGDASRARNDSDLTARRGVWNHFQFSSPI